MSTDQELLYAYAHRHDERAFAQLVERHAAMVLATCRRITHDHQDAEDASQAAFVVLAQKAPHLDGTGVLAAWLHRVACYIALRQRAARVRRRRVEVAMSAPLALGMTSHAAVGPDGEGEQMTWFQDVDAALVTVPILYRQPLILHYLEGRSCGEIAALLSISENLVAARLSRGRERLRRRLRPAPAFDLSAALTALSARAADAPESAWRLQSSPRAKVMADACLRTMWLDPASHAGVFATAILLLGLGLTWGWSSVHAEDAPRETASPTAAAPPLQPRLSVATCPLWQEQLLAALERRVTFQVRKMPALAILDSMGRQCDLTMVVDLPSERSPLPMISIDAHAIPLQQVLDLIAEQTGMRYELYAGSILWRDAQDGAPWDAPVPWQKPGYPMTIRAYRLTGLPAGTDAQTVLQDLMDHTGIDTKKPGMSLEIFGRSFMICASSTDQLAIESFLVSHWHQVPPAEATIPMRIETAPQGPGSTAVIAAARRLDDALQRSLGREVHASTLRAALAEIAAASEVVFDFAPSEQDVPLRIRPIPALLTHLAVKDVIALTLDGTGYHVAMRVDSPAGAGCTAILVVSKKPTLSMVTVRYHCDALAQGHSDVPWDSTILVDFLKGSVARDSWSSSEVTSTSTKVRESLPLENGTAQAILKGASVDISGTDLTITQSLEAQLAIQDQLPRLSATLFGAPLPAALTAPSPLTLTTPPSSAGVVNPMLAVPIDTGMPRQRL